jgi:[ribosomal protein S18]-alanine N-acetyltransferase
MSAQLQPRNQRRRMLANDVSRVQTIEAESYSFPWTPGNFIDSLAAGYLAEVLECEGTLVGYHVSMAGVDELHLLNLTVAPAWRGQGLGHQLLDVVQAHGQRLGLQRLLLEVRQSNDHARALYLRRGFADVGLRRGYYPSPQGREDAIVMALPLATGRGDALV